MARKTSKYELIIHELFLGVRDDIATLYFSQQNARMRNLMRKMYDCHKDRLIKTTYRHTFRSYTYIVWKAVYYKKIIQLVFDFDFQ